MLGRQVCVYVAAMVMGTVDSVIQFVEFVLVIAMEVETLAAMLGAARRDQMQKVYEMLAPSM